jgi:hypothetical protein
MGFSVRTFVSGLGQHRSKFIMIDPSTFTEAAFEQHVRDALSYVYDEYYCIPFRGAFESDGVIKVADLALIDKRYTHWFIIEVELVSHSLFNHVIPQVRCFQEGRALDSCISCIERQIPSITVAQAMTLVHLVPRSVAVVANRADASWANALKAINVQFMAVSIFEGQDGTYGVEADGSLYVPKRSLGFFTYSALNRTIRLTHQCELAPGEIEMEDPNGIVGFWTVRQTNDAIWVTKNIGDPGIADQSTLQVIRVQSGKLVLRSF